MSGAFGIALGWAGALGAAVLAPAAEARDDPPPPLPCPLTATLRVADAASLAGIQSLTRCSAVVAPARPDEVSPPPTLRIAPDAGPAGGAPASFHLASARKVAEGGDVRSSRVTGPMQVAAIAPHADEPFALASMAGIDGEAILAMRPQSYTTRYDMMIGRVAARQRIDPLLLHAVIGQESGYRVDALSSAGARGLMQLMPGTARALDLHGASIVDAEANVDGGARLLRRLHGRFNDFSLTLAAYNAGEGAVRKYGNRIPPYPETRNYVRQVLARYERLVAEQATGVR